MQNKEFAGWMGKKIIHGHTPTTLDSIRNTLFDPESSLINVDAGCVYPDYVGMGNLLGLNIDNIYKKKRKNYNIDCSKWVQFIAVDHQFIKKFYKFA